MPAAALLAAVPDTTRTNEQLELILRGWIGIATIAVVGLVGIFVIIGLLVVWRRTLSRQRRLEQQVRELRHSVTAIGDAWAASAKRVPGGPTALPQRDDEGAADDEDDEEADDPYNLFGGRDPLDDGFDDEDGDDEDGFEDGEDDEPPPGFR